MTFSHCYNLPQTQIHASLTLQFSETLDQSLMQLHSSCPQLRAYSLSLMFVTTSDGLSVEDSYGIGGWWLLLNLKKNKMYLPGL